MSGINSNLNNLFNQKNLLSAFNNRNKKDVNGDGKVDSNDTELKNQLDVNGDGKVNISDRTKIKKEVSNLEGQKLTFDLDGDGKLNLKDVILANNGVDINGDGKISDDEKKFIKGEKDNVNTNFNKQKMNDKLDINGDGKVNINDLTEFKKLTKDINFKNKYDSTSNILRNIEQNLNKKTLDASGNGTVNTRDLGYYDALRSGAKEYIQNKAENNKTYISDDFAKTNFDINGDDKIDSKDIETFDSAVEAIENKTGRKLEKVTKNSIFKAGQKAVNDKITAEQNLYKQAPKQVSYDSYGSYGLTGVSYDSLSAYKHYVNGTYEVVAANFIEAPETGKANSRIDVKDKNGKSLGYVEYDSQGRKYYTSDNNGKEQIYTYNKDNSVDVRTWDNRKISTIESYSKDNKLTGTKKYKYDENNSKTYTIESYSASNKLTGYEKYTNSSDYKTLTVESYSNNSVIKSTKEYKRMGSLTVLQKETNYVKGNVLSDISYYDNGSIYYKEDYTYYPNGKQKSHTHTIVNGGGTPNYTEYFDSTDKVTNADFVDIETGEALYSEKYIYDSKGNKQYT